MTKKELNREEEVKTPIAKMQNRGKKYQNAYQQVADMEPMEISQALELIEKTKVTSFDPSLEIHIHLSVGNIRGHVTLPGGASKAKKALIINEDNLEDEISKIESGKINFDFLVVKPDMMPKIAKLAKVLGPKGLMPNPKTGTVTEDPEKFVKEVSGGRVEYRQDKSNIIHLPVGKLSFGAEKLKANIDEVLKVMPQNKIKSVHINLTMGPSLKINMKRGAGRN